MDKVPYAMIPRSWAEPSSGLKPRDLHVAIALFSYGGTPTQPAFPSLKTLAKLTGTSVITVRRSIDKMVRLGLVRRVERKGTSTAYHMVWAAHTLLPQNEQRAAHPGRTGGLLTQDEHRVSPGVSHLISPAKTNEEKEADDRAHQAYLRQMQALVFKKAMP